MTEIQNSKREYDLEERTFQYAKAVRFFVKILPKTIANIEDGRQLIKASGSVGLKSKLVLVIEYCNLKFTLRLSSGW